MVGKCPERPRAGTSQTSAIPRSNSSRREDDDGDETDGFDDGYSEKLVPLLDLLQHSDEPNVRHRVVGDAVEVRARVDIEAGSEIWNQYRSEEEESMLWRFSQSLEEI